MSEDPKDIPEVAKRLAEVLTEIAVVERQAVVEGVDRRTDLDALNTERLELEAKLATSDTRR